MSTDQHKSAVERYVRATNAREPIDWYFGPGYVYHGPTGDLDQDGFIRQHHDFLAAFPDAAMTILDVTGADEKLVTRWMAEATHEGPLMGMAPTGRPVKITGIIITRFSNGKAVEEWEELNLLGLMQQVGAIPNPSP